MKFREFILQEISIEDAMRLIQGNSDDEIDEKYRKLARQLHPDRNSGSDADMKILNMALDRVKGKVNPGPASPQHNSRSRQDDDLPPWQTDYRSSYNVVGNDFRNLNFCKKTIYEEAINLGPVEKMMVNGFDNGIPRGAFEVFGNDKVYSLMGKAMEIWSHISPEAVFIVSDKLGNIAKIIRINKKDVDIDLEFDSFNRNPGNDRNFGKQLQKIIAHN